MTKASLEVRKEFHNNFLALITRKKTISGAEISRRLRMSRGWFRGLAMRDRPIGVGLMCEIAKICGYELVYTQHELICLRRLR